MAKTTKTANAAKITLSRVRGARKAAMPAWVEPMKAVLIDKPFDREGWIFENKWDGMRAMIFIDRGTTRIFSRNHRLQRQFPEFATLAESIRATTAILDGEIVAIGSGGRIDFNELQKRFGLTDTREIRVLEREQQLLLYLFDVVYVDGYDIRNTPLMERKQVLASIVTTGKRVKLADYSATTGTRRFAAAKRAGDEGVVAKDGLSRYVEGRSDEWLKIKAVKLQEAIICGYYPGEDHWLDGLEIAAYDDGKLVSIGTVRRGTRRDEHKLYELLHPLEIERSPLDLPAHGTDDVQWVRPNVICEIKFTAWTGHRHVRHSSFVGLRTDKDPRECVIELPQHAATSKRSAKPTVNAKSRSSKSGATRSVSAKRSALEEMVARTRAKRARE